MRKLFKSGDTSDGVSPPNLQESRNTPHENQTSPSTYDVLDGSERITSPDSSYQTLSHESQGALPVNANTVYYNVVSEPSKDLGPGCTNDQMYEAYEQENDGKIGDSQMGMCCSSDATTEGEPPFYVNMMIRSNT